MSDDGRPMKRIKIEGDRLEPIPEDGEQTFASGITFTPDRSISRVIGHSSFSQPITYSTPFSQGDEYKNIPYSQDQSTLPEVQYFQERNFGSDYEAFLSRGHTLSIESRLFAATTEINFFEDFPFSDMRAGLTKLSLIVKSVNDQILLLQPSLKEEVEGYMRMQLALNEYIDAMHDISVIDKFLLPMFRAMGENFAELYLKYVSSIGTNNFNPNKGHSTQEQIIASSINFLRGKKVIVPDLNKPIFVSKDDMDKFFLKTSHELNSDKALSISFESGSKARYRNPKCIDINGGYIQSLDAGGGSIQKSDTDPIWFTTIYEVCKYVIVPNYTDKLNYIVSFIQKGPKVLIVIFKANGEISLNSVLKMVMDYGLKNESDIQYRGNGPSSDPANKVDIVYADEVDMGPLNEAECRRVAVEITQTIERNARSLAATNPIFQNRDNKDYLKALIYGLKTLGDKTCLELHGRVQLFGIGTVDGFLVEAVKMWNLFLTPFPLATFYQRAEGSDIYIPSGSDMESLIKKYNRVKAIKNSNYVNHIKSKYGENIANIYYFFESSEQDDKWSKMQKQLMSGIDKECQKKISDYVRRLNIADNAITKLMSEFETSSDKENIKSKIVDILSKIPEESDLNFTYELGELLDNYNPFTRLTSDKDRINSEIMVDKETKKFMKNFKDILGKDIYNNEELFNKFEKYFFEMLQIIHKENYTDKSLVDLFKILLLNKEPEINDLKTNLTDLLTRFIQQEEYTLEYNSSNLTLINELNEFRNSPFFNGLIEKISVEQILSLMINRLQIFAAHRYKGEINNDIELEKTYDLYRLICKKYTRPGRPIDIKEDEFDENFLLIQISETNNLSDIIKNLNDLCAPEEGALQLSQMTIGKRTYVRIPITIEFLIELLDCDSSDKTYIYCLIIKKLQGMKCYNYLNDLQQAAIRRIIVEGYSDIDMPKCGDNKVQHIQQNDISMELSHHFAEFSRPPQQYEEFKQMLNAQYPDFGSSLKNVEIRLIYNLYGREKVDWEDIEYLKLLKGIAIKFKDYGKRTGNIGLSDAANSLEISVNQGVRDMDSYYALHNSYNADMSHQLKMRLMEQSKELIDMLFGGFFSRGGKIKRQRNNKITKRHTTKKTKKHTMKKINRITKNKTKKLLKKFYKRGKTRR